MAVGTQAEERHIEERPVRIKGCRAVGLLQCPFVAASRVFGGSVGRNGMNVLSWHGRFGEHRFAGHPKIAFGMIVRDETLVSPIPRHPLPRETISEFVRSQKSIKRLWRRSARKRDSERTLPGSRCFCHPRRHTVRQRQRTRQDLDVPDGLVHSAPANRVEPSMKASIAVAKPSSLYESVTAAACALTSSEALPMAMLKPDRLNISTSFG